MLPLQFIIHVRVAPNKQQSKVKAVNYLFKGVKSCLMSLAMVVMQVFQLIKGFTSHN